VVRLQTESTGGPEGSADYSAWLLLTDCSDTTMGACLAQLDEHGIERPVAYASCNLSTAQKNYGITDKEGLAIVWAVRKWLCTAALHW
jgi:hypothetical protein